MLMLLLLLLLLLLMQVHVLHLGNSGRVLMPDHKTRELNARWRGEGRGRDLAACGACLNPPAAAGLARAAGASVPMPNFCSTQRPMRRCSQMGLHWCLEKNAAMPAGGHILGM